MAVKPWVGDLKASTPADFRTLKGMELAPQNTLQIEYAFGFRSFDSRNMAKLLTSKSEVIFCTAALGITMNTDLNKQQFFQNHEEDIVSFDLHPNR